MNRETAERFTGALGKVFEGAVELADVGVELDMPEALGLTPAEWIERRIAGPVRLGRAERQLVVAANPDKTTRELGEALGVAHTTIERDRAGTDVPSDELRPQASHADAGTNVPVDDEPDDRRLGFLMSSASDDWATPQALFDMLASEFAFTLDVCASTENAKCERYFSAADDGLAQDWAGVCWMNPPYGDAIVDWVAKAHTSAQAGATVVCLLPARVDTGWWWDYCRDGEIRFMRGRLRFGSAETSAPFPSAVVIFGQAIRKQVVWWER